MSEKVRFRCRNCGHRFEAEALDKREQDEARRKGEQTSPIHCPKCNRADIRGGWD